MTDAPDTDDTHDRPDTEADLDTDDVTERHTGNHRDPSDDGTAVTLHDVEVGVETDKVDERQDRERQERDVQT